jgi:SAM-dependent methyltransferase
MDRLVQRGTKFWFPLSRNPVARVLKFRRLQEYLARLPGGGVVLDYGSGNQPYADLLATRFDRCLSADYSVTNRPYARRPDYEIVDNRLALPDASVDCVWCTEVLQHIYAPAEALQEMHRVLRPGGYLLGSVAYARGQRDAPHDYYRFTSFALRRLFRDAGFQIESLDFIGDQFGVMVTSLTGVLDLLPRLLVRLHLPWLAVPLRLVLRLPEFAYFALVRSGLDPGRIALLRQHPLGFTFALRKPDGQPILDHETGASAAAPAAARSPVVRQGGIRQALADSASRLVPAGSPLRARYRRARRAVLNHVGAHTGLLPAPQKWVFVVGCYNSGTTLLHDILATHPEVGSMDNEGQFNQTELLRPFDVGLGRAWSKRPELFRMDETTRSDVNVRRIKRQWGARYNFPERPVLLEKTPVNGARVRWLEREFENAHFIAILRNGYAVAEGIHRKAGLPLGEAARHWALANEIMLADLPHVRHSLVVRYEDLTNATDETVRRIAAFIGIDPAGIVTSGRVWKVHEKLSPIGDMNQRSLEALTAGDRAEIEAQAGDMLRQLGYLPAGNSPQPAALPA